MSTPEPVVPEQQTDHFLKSVTHMGDRQVVTNHRDINSESGVKLVAAGTRITSALFNKLVKHKLLPPLEQCLSVDTSVSHDSLHRECLELIQRDGSPFKLVNDTLSPSLLEQIIPKIPLPPPIAFKLTVAREERPELYTHSLQLMLLTIFLCRSIQSSNEEMVNAASAALLHDIGILHIDPMIFEQGRGMTLEERRHLYAHPIISHMIVSQFDEYPSQVGEAVLQHHERLDGTGYPYGLSAPQIGTTAQLLAVAELIASRFGGEGGCSNCAQLDLILKFNDQRLNAEHTIHLKPFFKESAQLPAESEEVLAECRLMMTRLSALFAGWETLHRQHPPTDVTEDEQIKLIERELQQLKKHLLQTGLALDENPASEANQSWQPLDDEHLAEVAFLLKEAGWQLGELYYLVHRRWPQLTQGSAITEWIEQLPTLYKS